MGRPRKYDDDQLRSAVEVSSSYAQVLKYLGLTGGNTKAVKTRIAELGLDASHFRGMTWQKGLTALEDSRIRVSDRPGRKTLRKWLVVSGVEYRCSRCGLDEWQDEVLVLDLHHIDGDHENSALSNLQFLCPNCHSLTADFRGRGKGKNKY